MSEKYENNLRLIRKYYPDLIPELRGCDDRSYRVESSVNLKHPNLIFAGNGSETIFYDPVDPQRHASDFVEQNRVSNARLVVLLGLGLGYHALELLKKKDQLIKLIIVEKDIACLKKAMEHVDLAELIDNPFTSLVVGVHESELYTAIHHAIEPNFHGLKEMSFFPWPASLKVAPEYYKQAMKTFSSVTDIWIAERGNDPYDTLVAYEQFFLNMESYLNNPGAGYMKGFFKGRPGIVVATGPSLKKSLHLLKEAENKAVIVSADASFKILRGKGIYPHFVTTVERPPGPAMFYEGLDGQEKSVLSVVSFAHPTTIEAYKGPKLLFHRKYMFMERLGLNDDCTQMGLSTANMAYEVARHLGCDPIILVGNDLSFDSSGNTHSEGFVHGERQELFEDMDRFEVPGNYEKTVTTCNDWFKCIKSYEKRISGWDGTLVNATAGGAKIQGSLVMPLNKVIKKYCVNNFRPRELILDHMGKWENKRDASSFLTKISEFIDHADWGINTSKKMLNAIGPIVREIESSGKSLSGDLQGHINEAIPHINTVLMNLDESPLINNFAEYFHTEMIPLFMEWHITHMRFEDPVWANAYRIKLVEDFFGAIGQICISLKEILQNAQERLNQL